VRQDVLTERNVDILEYIIYVFANWERKDRIAQKLVCLICSFYFTVYL